MSIEEEDTKRFKYYVIQKVRSIKIRECFITSKRESINRQKLGVNVKFDD